MGLVASHAPSGDHCAGRQRVDAHDRKRAHAPGRAREQVRWPFEVWFRMNHSCWRCLFYL